MSVMMFMFVMFVIITYNVVCGLLNDGSSKECDLEDRIETLEKKMDDLKPDLK